MERPSEAQSSITFSGFSVSDSDRRAIARWQKEGATPRLWKADAFLVRHGMVFREFEIWCEHEGIPALAFPELEADWIEAAEPETAGAAK